MTTPIAIAIAIAIADALWPRLHENLKDFSDRLASTDPTLISDLGRTANDAFLLRGYLAFRRYAGGDEIAITIDIRNDGQQLTFESDACTEDGKIIAVGPSTVVSATESRSNIEAAIGDWCHDFEKFLLENESALAIAVSKLR